MQNNQKNSIQIYLILILLVPIYLYLFSNIIGIDSRTQIAQVGSTLTNGLIAHYKFDEGSGTTVTDASGGNTGTLTNGPSWVGGKIGTGSLQFDGMDDSISLGNVLSLGTNSITVSVWIRSDSDSRQVVFSKVGPKFYSFELLNRSIARFYVSDGTTTHNSQFPISLTDGGWHNVVWVIDRTKSMGQIYFDGAEKKCSGNCIANLMSLGDITGSGLAYISGNPKSVVNGGLDDVRIYNRALSNTEINELYNLKSQQPDASATPQPSQPIITPVSITPSLTPSPTLDVQVDKSLVVKTQEVQIVPQIVSFKASSASIISGEKSILSWQVTNATEISIDQQIGIVTGTSIEVSPKQTTIYTISAKNGPNTVKATQTIVVTMPILKLESLSEDKNEIALLGSSINLMNQRDSALAYWSYYNGADSPEGGYMGWMFGGVSYLNGQIALSNTLSEGRYYIFIKGIAYFTSMNMEVSLGGSTSTISLNNSDYNKYWTTAGVVDVMSPTDSLFIRLVKGGNQSATEKFLIRGLYITKNPNEVVFKDDTVVDLEFPVVMDQSESKKGNVFENGSFEVGTGHGWALGYSRGVSQSSLWDNSVSKYGSASLKLPLTGDSGIYGSNSYPGDKILYSRIYTLKPNKLYTLSAWVKTDVPISESIMNVGISLSNVFGVSNLFAPPPGFPAQHVLTAQSGTLVPGVWKRISVSGYSLKYPTSDYIFRIWTNSHKSLNGSLWIDGIQLEEGNLTDFEPSQDVEIGLITNRASNIYYEDENYATLLAYNSTNQEKSKQINYEIYDYLNRKVFSSSKIINIPANTTSTTNLDINPGKRGIFRIVLWINNQNGTEEELSYSIVPRPPVLGADETSMMGIHPNYLGFQLEAMQRLGIKWARVLSPASFFRWSIVEPVDDQFVWYDSQIQLASNYGITTLGTLSTNNYWPAWANDPITGFMNLDKWEEFVGQVVNHYSKLGVKYWEVWNEPNYVFPASFYAKMLKRAVQAIETNDPNAKIVAMGGSYRYEYIKDVISELEKQYPDWDWKNHINIFSTHQYPIAQQYDSSSRYSVFDTEFVKKYGVSIWNTEAGVWDLGFSKGLNSNFISFGKNLWGSADAERYYRGSLTAAEFTVINFLQSAGNHISKYFYYDSRLAAEPIYLQHHPTMLEYDDTIRAKGIAYSIAGHFVDHSSPIGEVNLDQNTSAYYFNRGGVPVLALWTKDLTTKSLNLNLNRSVINAYDIMGNLITLSGSSIPIGRSPIYIEGNGISIADFTNALQGATVVSRIDLTAPSVSISQGPRGQTSLNNLRIRWIAVDETSVPGINLTDLSIPGSDSASIVPNNTDAILYSYRLLPDTTWSDWTDDTFIDLFNLENNDYIFEIKAKDKAGNVSSVVTREFSIGLSVDSEVPIQPTPIPTPSDPSLPDLPSLPEIPTPTPTPTTPSVPTPTPSTPGTGGGGGSAPSSPGGGGGGSAGGSSSVGTFTPTVVQKPLSTLCTPSTTTVTKLLIPTNLTNLAYGTRNASVLQLQNLLIQAGHLQQGYNTGYYGPLTRDALNKYKLAPQTQTVTRPCLPTTTTTTSRLPKSYIFTTTLKQGMTSPAVKYLQIFLNDNGFTVSTSGPGSKGNESSYFGPATAKALTKYQEYYAKDILTPYGLNKGTGYFGPATMRMVNGVQR